MRSIKHKSLRVASHSFYFHKAESSFYRHRPRVSSVVLHRYPSILSLSRFFTTPPRVQTRPDSAAIMSPMYLQEKLNIDRVAVIGAGPCGLAAAK